MALGIYKPKEGYWVRVMTACLVAALALAAAGWLWGQGALLADKAERSGYIMQIAVSAGTPAPGAAVELFGQPDRPDAPPPKIGTSTVQEYREAERVLRIAPPVMEEKHEVGESTQVKSGDGKFTANVVGRSVVGIASIDPLYVQGGLAGLAIIVGTIVAYWLAGTRPATVDFLIATDSEMKRVNWSTAREIRGSTMVVIGACFFMAGALFVFDFAFKMLFQAIGVLGT